ncbi:MAG: TonB-dependent receptor plug domain-containing protein, partial [Bacteroidota bacterium]
MKKITTLLNSFFSSHAFLRVCMGAFLLIACSGLQAQSNVLKGLILDTGSGSVMPGAEIVLVEKSRIAFTDVNGIFSFGRVEPAIYTLQVRYLGYKTDTIQVNLVDSTAEDITIYMIPDAITTEEVVISSQALGQTKAINQQLNSDAIANIVSADRIQELPDVNAAEAIARLPGIAINRNGGEGQKIVIRGLEPKFASININGVSLPSNASTDRSVDLSLISPELLDGIEVFKSPLPDMDAEAVGGTVNLKLRKAPKRFRMLVKGLGGYNALNDDVRDYKGIFQISNRILDDVYSTVKPFQARLENNPYFII